MRSSRSSSEKAGADPLFAGSSGFAHRGLHRSAIPENSMAAFRAAIEADGGIECDVRLSKDRFPIIFHDGSLERLCGAPISPEQSYAEELFRFGLEGTDERIPWLGELLDEVAGRVPILLELKEGPGPIEHLCRAVEACLKRYDGPVGIMSFSPRVGAWFLGHAPHRRRGLVMSGRETFFERWVEMVFVRPHFLAVSIEVIDRPWVRRARRRALIACWTVRTPADRSLAANHADALIWETDGRP